MERRWKVEKKGNVVSASFKIAKNNVATFSSLNPKDFHKYFEIMMDEIKFRKLFQISSNSIQFELYEEMMESD